MKNVILVLVVALLMGCSVEKPLIAKDTELKTNIENKTSEQVQEEKESVYVYDIIKKESYWMNKTKDAGNPCKVAAECEGWCEPMEGSKQGKCSWFPRPIGCKKRVERFEIFDVCANLTMKS